MDVFWNEQMQALSRINISVFKIDSAAILFQTFLLN
jgi:hypothetical protein